MAEETSTTTAVAETAESTPAATPAAEPKKTESEAAEHMIPKSRFDEVNKELRELRKAQEAQAKAAADAEQKRLAEEGRYKELFEKQQAALQEAESKARANELRILRREAAEKAGLPLALADRLQGETADDLEKDAKAILAALPKPAVPNTNAASGNGAVPGGNQSAVDVQEKSARYGVRSEYWTN